MKVFIAITCLAFVASAFGSDPSVPPSLGGSLFRTKSGLLNNAADRWDRWVHGFRGIIPFGSVNVKLDGNAGSAGFGAGLGAATPIASSTAVPGVAALPTATTAPTFTTIVTSVDCTKKAALKTRLDKIEKDLADIEKLIDDPATGLKKVYDDAAAATVTAAAAAAAAGAPATAAAAAATAKDTETSAYRKFTTAQNTKLTLEISKVLLEPQLERYASCP